MHKMASYDFIMDRKSFFSTLHQCRLIQCTNDLDLWSLQMDLLTKAEKFQKNVLKLFLLVSGDKKMKNIDSYRNFLKASTRTRVIFILAITNHTKKKNYPNIVLLFLLLLLIIPICPQVILRHSNEVQKLQNSVFFMGILNMTTARTSFLILIKFKIFSQILFIMAKNTLSAMLLENEKIEVSFLCGMDSRLLMQKFLKNVQLLNIRMR
uniref:Transmembrane protein n=1 Tax=virus sp. ctkyY8 TaxID=2827995 RepID=A0A8S5REI9_9VIRU|nr:MAG TPA: hypothetical protein [virus sp. ctkyY8]